MDKLANSKICADEECSCEYSRFYAPYRSEDHFWRVWIWVLYSDILHFLRGVTIPCTHQSIQSIVALYVIWQKSAQSMYFLILYTVGNLLSCCFCCCSLSDAISMAVALDDFTAPDCRFINIRKDQMIYVYSKLTPEEGTGVFWSGSVCSMMTGLFPELQKHFHHCSQYVFRKWFIQTVFVNSCWNVKTVGKLFHVINVPIKSGDSMLHLVGREVHTFWGAFCCACHIVQSFWVVECVRFGQKLTDIWLNHTNASILLFLNLPPRYECFCHGETL